MIVVIGTEALYTPEAAGPGRIVVDGGIIVDVAGPGPADVSVPILAPGMVDLQCNGISDVLFARCDASGWDRAGRLLAAAGTTTVLPTLVTGSDVDAVAAVWPGTGGCPDMAGLHLEGPMLSPQRRGAHDPSLMRPLDVDHVLSRPVRLVTLAPEVVGALDAAAALTAGGVTVAAGHSDATADEAAVAFDAGVGVVTHLWNAMAPMRHRAPGLVGAALTDERVTVCVIGDGVHVDRRVVLLTWRCVGTGRFAAVTDAVGVDAAAAAAGLSVDGAVVRSRDGSLQGSAVTMDQVLRNLVTWGIPLADAVAATTTTPAAAVGLTDRGRLQPGRRADLAAFDDELRVIRTWCAGRPLI